MRVAVVSDTHGLLRPEVLPLLADANHILHAGDVGDMTILHRMAEMAPVTAIRGNIDVSGPCSALSATDLVELDGVAIYLVHSVQDLDIRPESAGVRVVISGHSHSPSIEERGGVLYLNPGSIGPRRFRLPVSMAMLFLSGGEVTAELIPVD